MRWYRPIADSLDQDDLSPLADAALWFENELVYARSEVKLQGRVQQQSQELPGIVEQRFAQFQEVLAIKKLLEIRFTKVKNKAFRKYFESYARQLSSRDAEKYADAEDEVQELAILINHFDLLANYYQGVIKGLDTKHWQINGLIKLKTAGMEDYDLNIGG
jgi:hypothetical protein